MQQVWSVSLAISLSKNYLSHPWHVHETEEQNVLATELHTAPEVLRVIEHKMSGAS